MESELQRLVDGLGRRLDRSVAIDDRNIRLLAYNAHLDGVDDARVESILRRSVPHEMVRYIQSIAMAKPDEVFTLPARPDLGLTVDRVGVPIRYRGALLGFLWLLASDGPVTAEQADAATRAADTAAEILHRDHLVGELARGRERELLRDLIAEEPRLHHDAAERLIEEDLLCAGRVVAIAVTLTADDDTPLQERDRLALATGLERVRHTLPPRSAIHLARPDHGVLVLVRADARKEVSSVADAIHREVCAGSDGKPSECRVGIGDLRPRLAEARDSYLEAMRAAEVAGVVRVLGSVVSYADLGVYGLLAELPPDRLRRSVHAGLTRLLEADAGDGILTATLEAFLDNAGSIKKTAEQLCVHRASVYSRLERIERIAGVDLADGGDRLAVHIGLKVAELVGVREAARRR
ncbi:CdaR family transcriptional regulator [Tsukamurella asaccharolytica]|uniref:CdaR family transcriptional regulator n=1 Tax=Tsukamurella asaccharolytica TaxID=2592067 RepID=A0A5C5R955_9ACTN|nr:helix-turn-helix domain-containing protein [Tsukamurella asaccharolytica]TWS19378.1 CdaR family transcriptional regulator [Tsukamurella asaccharolytica]